MVLSNLSTGALFVAQKRLVDCERHLAARMKVGYTSQSTHGGVDQNSQNMLRRRRNQLRKYIAELKINELTARTDIPKINGYTLRPRSGENIMSVRVKEETQQKITRIRIRALLKELAGTWSTARGFTDLLNTKYKDVPGYEPIESKSMAEYIKRMGLTKKRIYWAVLYLAPQEREK